jgi:hypothetical protein
MDTGKNSVPTIRKAADFIGWILDVDVKRHHDACELSAISCQHYRAKAET